MNLLQNHKKMLKYLDLWFEISIFEENLRK